MLLFYLTNYIFLFFIAINFYYANYFFTNCQNISPYIIFQTSYFNLRYLSYDVKFCTRIYKLLPDYLFYITKRCTQAIKINKLFIFFLSHNIFTAKIVYLTNDKKTRASFFYFNKSYFYFFYC